MTVLSFCHLSSETPSRNTPLSYPFATTVLRNSVTFPRAQVHCVPCQRLASTLTIRANPGTNLPTAYPLRAGELYALTVGDILFDRNVRFDVDPASCVPRLP